MDELRTRAQLVAYDRAGTGIGTVVTRAEIAEAAAEPAGPATLLLDLDRAEGGGEVTAHARVAVDWDQETLEQLLASTGDDEIALWFDERELALAFDDVEAHGLRERTAVLAVAVAAAGLSASPALARTIADTGGAGTAVAGVGANLQAGVPDVPVGGAERALVQEQKLAPATSPGTISGGSEVTSNSGGTLSSGELAAAVAGGAVLIAAAGFGATRRRTPPALPA